MSCALNRMPDQDLQVQYVRCFMDVYKYAPIDDNQNGQKVISFNNLVKKIIKKNISVPQTPRIGL